MNINIKITCALCKTLIQIPILDILKLKEQIYMCNVYEQLFISHWQIM
jgi:hypothetical protein